MITLEENIFDLLGKGSTVYHSAILTSFTFDPYYFSNYYMSQMRSRGIKNVVVLIDSTQYDAILEDTETFKNFRHDFALIRVKNKTNGVFHPKVSLFLGDKQALALVGSGNLTYSGISHNKELWGAFCADAKESDEAIIIKDIWDFLSGRIRSSSSQVAIQQLEWCKIYSAAIRGFESIESPQQNDFKFLYAKPEVSIFSQIREILKGEVNAIKVIAPFYDMEGSLINTLKSSFKPKMIKCAIDESYGYIPQKIKDSSDIQFFHWHEIFGSDNKFELAKKLHAKAIQFETSEGTFFVLGSANATSAAFGLNSHSFNDEANIIIHSDKEDFFKRLGIDFGKQCVKSINDFHSVAKYSIRSANEALITHITLCERHLHDKLYISFDKIVADAKIRLCLDDGYRDFDFNKDELSSIIPVSMKRREDMREIELTYFREDFLKLHHIDLPRVIHLKNPSRVRDLILRLIDVYTFDSEIKEFYMEGLLKVLLATIIEEHLGYHEEDQKSDTLSLLVRYMAENLQTNLTLRDFELKTNLTGWTLNELFRKTYKTTPKKYYDRLRLGYAKNLIRYSFKSIKEISELLNFNAPQTFSRWFYKLDGRYPTEYKKSNINTK